MTAPGVKLYSKRQRHADGREAGAAAQAYAEAEGCAAETVGGSSRARVESKVDVEGTRIIAKVCTEDVSHMRNKVSMLMLAMAYSVVRTRG